MIGLASSEAEFLDAITLTFKEFRANILDIDDVEVLDLRDHLDDVDPDILGAISLLSTNNKLELATIDYYLERLDH